MYTRVLSVGVLAPMEPVMTVSWAHWCPERSGLPVSVEEREAQRGEMVSVDEIMN